MEPGRARRISARILRGAALAWAVLFTVVATLFAGGYALEDPGWPAGYLGRHEKPLVLLDPDGHFEGLLRWLDSLVPTGYVSRAALDRLIVVRDVGGALDLCADVRGR